MTLFIETKRRCTYLSSGRVVANEVSSLGDDLWEKNVTGRQAVREVGRQASSCPGSW